MLSTSETCCPRPQRLNSSQRTSETLCPVEIWDKLSSQSRAPCCPVIDGTKRLTCSSRTNETLCPLKFGTSISGRLICLNRQGQGCRNGRTVFLQRRHRLPEHSTPPGALQCRTPRACRARAIVPECRRNAAAPNCPLVPRLARRQSAPLFHLERAGRNAFQFGPRFFA